MVAVSTWRYAITRQTDERNGLRKLAENARRIQRFFVVRIEHFRTLEITTTMYILHVYCPYGQSI